MMTQKELMTKVRALGLTIRCEDGEYRINLKGSPEAHAYYTNDRADALGTARQIAQQAGKSGHGLAEQPGSPEAVATKLTTNELAVLRAIDSSEYGDALCDQIWSFSIADNSDLPQRSIPGIVSSLAKKGLTVSGASGGEDTVAMTLFGATTYINAVNGTNKKGV